MAVSGRIGLNEQVRASTPPAIFRGPTLMLGPRGCFLFAIDLEANAVIHHVEGSWFPNLTNTTQTRHFRFEGPRLVLNADTEMGTGPDRMGTRGCHSGINLTA
jgi:Lipocalin-like domain